MKLYDQHRLGAFLVFLVFLFFFRSSLESVYQYATLKIAKWNLLTRSQLCLSPSHFKHSPTLLTLSQSGKRLLNMKVDEGRLIKKEKLGQQHTNSLSSQLDK